QHHLLALCQTSATAQRQTKLCCGHGIGPGGCMSSQPTASSFRFDYPPGFRVRRGLNWGFLGLLYTTYYMCRYNFSIANKPISAEFGFNRAEMGKIITTALFAYACGQIINGLITDRIGGKRAMLIGAGG